MYQLTTSNSIKLTLPTGSEMFLPAETNGTPEWREYQAWLEAGNTPEPAPAPPAPPAPGPDYITFWDALLVASVYQTIRTQASTSLPMNTAATEFIALLGDAKAGRPNETAIQSSINAILTTGTFTEDHLDELQEALESGHLQDIYILT
jgi:hypothetical protein